MAMGLRASPRLLQPFIVSPLLGLLVVAANCQAPEYEVLREPNPVQRKALAEKFVAERLKLWQHRLNLENWKIRVNLVRAADLRPGTLGNIRWDANRHQATIKVMRVEEYPVPLHTMLDDMEFTIVHELLHLELSALPRSEASRSDEEHTINRLTKSMIKLERGY
jgi:hypothetical protein